MIRNMQNEIGCVVTWEAPKEVEARRLIQVMMDLGFDTKNVQKMLPRNAFARAARQMQEERIIRKLEESNDLLVFQFTREFLDGHEFKYSKEAVLVLDKVSGQIECDQWEIKDLAERLMDEQMAKRTRADVTRWIKKIFEQEGSDLVPLRKNGGVYFVPSRYQDLVDRLDQLLQQIGGELNVFHFANDSQTQESVAKAMADYLADLIQQFEESIEGFNPDTKEFMVERRQIEIAELKLKLQQYEDVLGALTQKIRQTIQQAEQKLVEKLQGRLNQSLVVGE